MALYGGHVADCHDRRRILRRTLGALIVCAFLLALLETTNLGKAHLVMIYCVVFLAGIARGFAELRQWKSTGTRPMGGELKR